MEGVKCLFNNIWWIVILCNVLIYNDLSVNWDLIFINVYIDGNNKNLRYG